MMKQIMLLCILCFSLVLATAQGLQFSQVLSPQVAVAGAANSISTIGTVPPGKVWKIENYVVSIVSTTYFALVINGASTPQYVLPHSGGGNWYLNSGNLWFPAGTTLAVKRVSGSTADNLLFNILEFSVTP